MRARSANKSAQQSKTFASADQNLLFYGDPHGNWTPLLRACAEDPPRAIVLLGDYDLQAALHLQLAPIFAAGIKVYWIPGNHDTGTATAYDYLWRDHAEGNLHARCVPIGLVNVAGLGGVFKGRVWYPRYDAAEPVSTSRANHLLQIPGAERWRDGLPLKLRDAIFPEDIDALGQYRADVLVTHEAPSSHQYGFVGVDLAAAACGARLIVHGHHHHSSEGTTASGVRVRGLAKAEVFRLRREDVS